MLCGPSDVVFKKPAILSFQHCAALKQGQWSLSVFFSDSAPEDPPNWQVRSRPPSGTIIVLFYFSRHFKPKLELIELN